MGLKYRPERILKWRGWTFTFGVDNIPVPTLQWFWWDQDVGFFDLSVDSGGDPIVSISSPIFKPRRLMPLVELLERG